MDSINTGVGTEAERIKIKCECGQTIILRFTPPIKNTTVVLKMAKKEVKVK